VVYQFATQTPLTIKKHWCLQGTFSDSSQECPFMQVGVNDIGPELFGNDNCFVKQEDVEIWLVPGWTGGLLAIPGDVRDSDGWDIADITAKVVGDNDDFVASGFEGFGLFVDTYVTAPVGEIWGGSNHENFEAGGHKVNTLKS